MTPEPQDGAAAAAPAPEQVGRPGPLNLDAMPAGPATLDVAAGRRRTLRGLPPSLWAWGSLLVACALIAVLAPVIAPDSPTAPNYANILQPPFSEGHLLGTDQFGRDMLSRTIYGARTLMIASLGSVLLALAAGFAIGTIAAYWGRAVETVLMRLTDLLLSIPLILLALILATGLGSGLRNLVIAIGISQTPVFARLVRALMRRELQREYALAARVSGLRPLHLVFREVTPNLVGPVVVQATGIVGVAAGYAAALSYLGVGISPPEADWGLMAREGQEYITRQLSVALIPAAAITIFVVAWNFLGDALRDVFDRSNRGRV